MNDASKSVAAFLSNLLCVILQFLARFFVIHRPTGQVPNSVSTNESQEGPHVENEKCQSVQDELKLAFRTTTNKRRLEAKKWRILQDAKISLPTSFPVRPAF
jgi:hypothetical protein